VQIINSTSDSLTSKKVPVKPMHVISKQIKTHKHSTIEEKNTLYQIIIYQTTLPNANLSNTVKGVTELQVNKHH